MINKFALSLDEMINYYEEWAAHENNDTLAVNAKQVARWLMELRSLRIRIACIENTQKSTTTEN